MPNMTAQDLEMAVWASAEGRATTDELAVGPGRLQDDLLGLQHHLGLGGAAVHRGGAHRGGRRFRLGLRLGLAGEAAACTSRRVQ